MTTMTGTVSAIHRTLVYSPLTSEPSEDRDRTMSLMVGLSGWLNSSISVGPNPAWSCRDPQKDRATGWFKWSGCGYSATSQKSHNFKGFVIRPARRGRVTKPRLNSATQ